MHGERVSSFYKTRVKITANVAAYLDYRSVINALLTALHN